MKHFILALALFFFAIKETNAQFKVIAETKKFSEPAYMSEIIQMKNGNTALLSLNSGGFDIRIYDAGHNEKANSGIPSVSLKSVMIENVFEINGDIILFLSGFDDGNIPTITRFIIDANTGKQKEQKILATSDKRGKFNNTSASFTVKKDPASDHYAIGIYHILRDEREKRVEVIQYDGQHAETKRTFLVSDDKDDYKFFVMMDMIIVDANRVNVFLYNGKEKYYSSTKKGRLVMATINSKTANPIYTVINLPEEIKFSLCTAVYNPENKKIYVLVAEERHKDDPIQQYYIKIDAQTNKNDVIPFKRINEEVNKNYRDKYSIDADFFGSFRELHINKDESFTVIYEIRFAYTATGGGMGFGSSGTTSTFYSGKILVVDYTKQAQVAAAWFAPKLYIVDTYSPYKIFKYINTGKSRYLCFNDTERNNDVQKDKFVEIRAVGEMDAFYNTLTGTNNFPKREYIFGDKEKGHELLAFGTSNYNIEKNVLVTLRLSKESPSDREVSLIWLQPQ